MERAVRFKRVERYASPGITVRKAAAIEQKRKREAARYPLFSDQIVEQQPPIDLGEEERIRQSMFKKSEQSWRDLHARQWRTARRKYFAATQEQREAIRNEWNRAPYPLEGSYLTYVIEKHTGEADRRMAEIKARDYQIAKQVWEELSRQAALL